MNDEDCKKLLKEWHDEYLGSEFHNPMWLGFKDLGNSVRGRTYYWAYPNRDKEGRFGKIEMNSRLKSDWRIKATLWHEFCHHWAYAEYEYSSHQGIFDTLVRRKKGLWLLCSLSRLLPI